MTGPQTSPEFLTFGCRLNAYETEVMRTHAAAAGLGDAVIVNTCAVTNEATRQARQAIRKVARERPGTRIIVTGCGAQIEPETYAAMPEVARVIGNGEKLDAGRWATLFAPETERIQVNDAAELRETGAHLIEGFAERTRAYVQVQNGCNHRCTFCIIPYGRGPSRSVPMGAVAAQIRQLAENGVPEIVLTGVDMTSYGADLDGRPSLGRLVKAILKTVPDLKRLRLSSVDPVEIDESLIDAFASEPRLMPHLHLSLQSGDDMILKRMKRRHARADAIALAARLKSLRPDIVFGADLIAGFPTETEEMAARSRDIVAECGLTLLHVFPFSPKAGTPAARMPQLPIATIKARAKALRTLGQTALADALRSRIGATESVLIERKGFGRTEGFLPVATDAAAESGAILRLRMTDTYGERLIASQSKTDAAA